MQSTEKDALQLLTWAFGIAPEALPADNIANAHLAEQRTALHMMNVLWRGTFADYLLELWNPPLGDDTRLLNTSTLYATRSYAVAYLRPTGALPLLRVGKQPYGILPVVGKRFTAAGSAIENGIGHLIGVLRPLWELAVPSVPTLTDGNVDKAKAIVQTAPWSQAAFYRDKDAGKAMCKIPNPITDAQQSSRGGLIKSLLAAVGITEYWLAHIYSCSDFLPDPPYSAGYLAGVPWVLADDKNPKIEAVDEVTLHRRQQLPGADRDGLDPDAERRARGVVRTPVGPGAAAGARRVLGAEGAERRAGTLRAAEPRGQPGALADDDEDAVRGGAARERSRVHGADAQGAGQRLDPVGVGAIDARRSSGDDAAGAVCGEAVGRVYGGGQSGDLGRAPRAADAQSRRRQAQSRLPQGASRRRIEHRVPQHARLLLVPARRVDQRTREPAARADARGRSARRLRRRLRVGGEPAAPTRSPDSDGYLLAPSLGQASTAAIMRSGFLANHETGAFDVALDSRRTQRAAGVLQGLTRDQPLAALYGYRIERGLRDALLGRFIWPLRLAFPWRPAGAAPTDEPSEAIGARDVVDGVALLDAWEANPNDCPRPAGRGARASRATRSCADQPRVGAGGVDRRRMPSTSPTASATC